MIRCPHCEEEGCDGRCRFRVGRRGFIGLALGAAAAAILPAPRETYIITAIDGLAGLAVGESVAYMRCNDAFVRAIKEIYSQEQYFAPHESTFAPMLAGRRLRSWDKKAPWESRA